MLKYKARPQTRNDICFLNCPEPLHLARKKRKHRMLKYKARPQTLNCSSRQWNARIASWCLAFVIQWDWWHADSVADPTTTPRS